MEKRSLSLCLEAPGACAAQFIGSERRTAAKTCVMPSDRSNKKRALRRLRRPRAVDGVLRDARKATNLMLASDPIGSNGGKGDLLRLISASGTY
jgi:hypothetical protein